MARCATCYAPAVVLYDSRGSLGTVRYRAAAACEQHRRATRKWVAGAGPTVTETPVEPDPDAELDTLF